MQMRRREINDLFDASQVPTEFQTEFVSDLVPRGNLIRVVSEQLKALGYTEVRARLLDHRPPQALEGMNNTQRPDVIGNHPKRPIICCVVMPEDIGIKLEGRLQLMASAAKAYKADFAIACPGEVAVQLRGRMNLWGITSSYFWPLDR